jgi:hypothetical protein
MKKLGARGRRWLLSFHVFLISLWLGTGLSMIIVMLANGDLPDGDELYATNAALKIMDDFVIIPSALGALLTGLLISLFTNWGFFRFTWVTVKWIAAVSLVIIGTFFLGPWLNQMAAISDAERCLALENPVYLYNRQMLIILATVQVFTLIFLLFVSVLKPWGRMRKKKQAIRDD